MDSIIYIRHQLFRIYILTQCARQKRNLKTALRLHLYKVFWFADVRKVTARFKSTHLPALEVKIKIPFDNYEDYIKKEREVHGVKWIYKSSRCISRITRKGFVYI